MSFSSANSSAGRFAVWSALSTGQKVHAAGLVALHLAALIVLYRTEPGIFGLSLSLLVWVFLNALLLALFRRPGIAALVSLFLIAGLIAISRFKFDVTWMTATFLDVLIIDPDTVAFLFAVFPDLRLPALAGAIFGIPLLVAVWWFDAFRVRRLMAAACAAFCLFLISALSLAVPEQPWEPFQGVNHVSNFFRSAALSMSELGRKGWLDYDSDAQLTQHLKTTAGAACEATAKRPHIIMLLDESSFDVSTVPGMLLPANYDRHFKSFDGKKRSFGVETTGGPTWYTEYNVLTGLSARSFGKLMFYVTRIAAGRVERGLPQTLRKCGYKTFSLYPAYGAFLSARRFQKTAGIGKMYDSAEMGAGDVEPDHFYFNQALQLFAREQGSGPIFMFLYTVANHFPWDTVYRPDLTPGWRHPGNNAQIDEYLRRQSMSAQDYTDFVEQLRLKFPGEPFLIVRFGDHQPNISSQMLDPKRDKLEIARAIMARDPRYFRTYYAINAVNFKPVDISRALDMLDAPYLPLVVLEAAGLPLDASFAEQKEIMKRCGGSFYTCRDGAEARRFNRLLINAGLIKGL